MSKRNNTQTGKTGQRYTRKPVDGFILVDKPKGITSFDVIRRLRETVSFKKMGHMGTLDPNATGLLPICTGRATRLSRFLLKGDKTYRAFVRLGRQTNTYDADGTFVGDPIEPPDLTQEEIEEVLAAFVGDIRQVPPLYSAKKVDGKRMYEYARAGEEVERKACSVRIDEIVLEEYSRERLVFTVSSGSGMYVRSLAHDIGQKLGCGAHLEDLTRTRVGNLFLDEASTLEEIAEKTEKNDLSFILPMHELLPKMPIIPLNRVQIDRISNGSHVVVSNLSLSDGDHVRLMLPEQKLAAIGVVQKPLGSMQVRILPKVVFV